MQELLKEMFGKPLCYKINPDEAVAYGATVQAALLTGQIKDEIKFTDVTALSLGVGVRDKQGNSRGVKSFSKIVKRNSQLPITRSNFYKTTVDN